MVIGVFTDGQVSGDLLPSLVFCVSRTRPVFFRGCLLFPFLGTRARVT